MTKIKLNTLFKKIQKDDKKEVLEFHVLGDELPHANDLVSMAGGIVMLEVTNSEAGSFHAEFKSIQRDSKKTVLKFNVKGDNEEKVIKLYPFGGHNVSIELEPSQMSFDDFYNEENEHEGIEYKVEKDGTASVINPDQMSIDDVEEDDILN